MRKHIDMFVFCVLFSGWAFITCLNDILTNILKNLFKLTQFESQLVPFAFFIAYFVGSLIIIFLPVFKINIFARLGLKKTVLLGLFISAIGCLIFIPAAHLKSYSVFLIGLFTIGFGFTFLQISVNPMVLSCGSPDSAASRLNLAGGFNSLATSLSPIIGAIILYDVFNVANHPQNLKYPYIFLALSLLLLALMVQNLLKPKNSNTPVVNYQKLFVLNHSNLVFGAIALFFYVGAEVSIGTNLISYLKSGHSLGLSDHLAAKILAFYWGGAMIGRFFGGVALGKFSPIRKKIYMVLISVALTILIIILTGFYGKDIIYYLGFQIIAMILLLRSNGSPRKSMVLFALINIINILIGSFIHGSISTWVLLSVGIFNSIMWPNIFDLSLKGLGDYREQGSSFLILTLLGGALLPVLQGKIADIAGISISFVVPAVGYVYIMCYGIFYSTKTYKFIK